MSFFSKIKKLLGLYPEVNYYKIGEKTGEPVKVSYEQPAPPPAPIPEPPPIEEPISSQEAAVDTKDDGIDLTAMTKGELVTFAAQQGIIVSGRMKKQDIIDKINELI
jgi:FtsZ-interacting cell division protein YlmF